jgi:O-antigen/teichoic acid export membrane protein
MAMRTALFWSGIQSVLRLTLSFVSIKVTAVYLGPAGLALVGQLGNFINLIQGSVANAIQTAIVKLTAESEGDSERQRSVWQTGFIMALALGIFVNLVVMASARPISSWLFDSSDYWPVIVLAGPCIVLGILGVIFTGILNGLKCIRELALVTIFTTIIGAAIFVPLAYQFGVWGGLIGTPLSGAAIFFMAWFMLRRKGILGEKKIVGNWDAGVAREIRAYYPMLLASAAAAPFALILVRNILTSESGLDAAGYWQAAWRLSDMYTMVMTTALSFYLMPHLASMHGDTPFARALFGTAYKVALLTAAGALAIYAMRDFVIAIVFTLEFAPIRELLPWQLVGDVFKMACAPLRMALVIKLRTKWYVAIVIMTPLLHAAFTFALLPQFQTNAATLGYALAYMITFVLLLVALRDYFVSLRRERQG